MTVKTDPAAADGDEAPTKATIDAVGTLGEAMEYVERARGHLYSFHHLIGRADLLFGQSAVELADAGWKGLGTRLHDDVEGRDVIPDRWTYQVVEEFDTGYWQPIREFVDEVRQACVGGQWHLSEAQMKRQRRTE